MNRFARALRRLDSKLVSLVVEFPSKLRLLLVIIILAMLVGCAVLFQASGPAFQVDILFFPIMLACVFFRARGLYFIPVALVLYHQTLVRQGLSVSQVFSRDFISMGKWLFFSLLVIYSVKKFGQIKRYQERVDQDVDLAKALQKTLLSKDFDLRRIRVLGYIHQCMEVGGDFYYFRPFKKKYIVLSIGDVMGKGIPASFVMAVVMGFFYEWGKKSYSPAFILDKINKRIIDLWGEGIWYSTIFYSVLDEETNELTYANGGHQKAILLRESGDVEILEVPGYPVGIFSSHQWEERKVTLDPGDRLILFTDGLTEARNAQGELYSVGNLLEKIDQTRTLSLEAMREQILNDVIAHAGPSFESDDIALVMLEVKRQESPVSA